MSSPEQMVNVRYMVDDVQAAVDFHTGHLGFTLRSSAAPAFAGPGGKQILIEDPAGNVIELFEPAASSPARS
jgi:catechol 2,3-dioxygenase-like lactoylglutathione lyase family enzyme